MGDSAPESYLWLEVVRFPKELAARLGIEEGSAVEMAVASVDGMNHHDRFTELRKRLGCSFEHLVASSTAIWLESHAEDARSLVEEIRDCFRSSL